MNKYLLLICALQYEFHEGTLIIFFLRTQLHDSCFHATLLMSMKNDNLQSTRTHCFKNVDEFEIFYIFADDKNTGWI